MNLERLFAVVALGATLTGCPGPSDGTGATSGGTGGAAPNAQPASPNAAVRFKGPDRLRNDLARGLSLDASELCSELGKFSCTDVVHTVTLGGVAPYDRQIFEPSRETMATTPLAAERVVLSACAERAKRDFEQPASAALWAGLTLDGAALADPKSASVQHALDALYVKLLARHASSSEVDVLSGLYATVVAKGSAQPARDWAALACFAVGSSTEFLFY